MNTSFKLLLCLSLILSSLAAYPQAKVGGGGDGTEMRFDSIRREILKWILNGGPNQIDFEGQIHSDEYKEKMTKILRPNAVVVAFVEKDSTSDEELKVSVDGMPKTCRGFISKTSKRPTILCNISRFNETSLTDQYKLVHHEYAGLVLIEKNDGASSDYYLSTKISDLIFPQENSTKELNAVKCQKPVLNIATAFALIEKKDLNSLKTFLKNNIVAKTARNERCENLYLAGIRNKSLEIIIYLDSINYGPKEEDGINTPVISVDQFAPLLLQNLNTEVPLKLNYYEYALINGNAEIITNLKSKGGRLSSESALSGLTELMMVCYRNSDDVVEKIMRDTSDLNEKNSNGETAFFIAAAGNSTPVINILIKNGANIDLPDENMRTSLIIASTRNTKDIIETLIKAGVDIHAVDNDGKTALIHASYENTKDVVETLIKVGSDIHAVDNDGRTALMHASYENNKDVVETLIRAGADIHAVDKDGATVLMYAASENTKDVVETLIRAGADIHAVNKNGGTVLMYASHENTKEVVETLIRSGADINAVGKENITALMVAAWKNTKDVIITLLKAGAHKNIKSVSGHTAYEYAKDLKRTNDILSLLKI